MLWDGIVYNPIFFFFSIVYIWHIFNFIFYVYFNKKYIKMNVCIQIFIYFFNNNNNNYNNSYNNNINILIKKNNKDIKKDVINNTYLRIN